jgi:hypothetical protein
MWTPEELTQHIEAERARQALLDRPGVPAGVHVGSLTALVMDSAAWRDTNAYPSSQEWADESEKLFSFAVSHGASKGEFTVEGPARAPVFTEVKSPGWEGELAPQEFSAGRQHQPKHLYCDGRAVAPWERVQF